MVVEDEAVGDRTDLAAEGFGRECGRVDGLGQDDDLTGAAAAGVLVAKSDDCGVLGRHTSTLASRQAG